MSVYSRIISEHVALTCDHKDAGGPEWRAAIICFFVLCSVLGVPLSWRKAACGDTVSWVGFEVLHRSHKIGLSERRAQWSQRWTRETAEASCVHKSAFEEGLGRVMCVAGALEFERPFLYRFLTLLVLQFAVCLPKLCSYSGTWRIGIKSRDIATVLQSSFHRILLLGSMLKPVTDELEWEVGARFSTKLASRTRSDLDGSVWR